MSHECNVNQMARSTWNQTIVWMCSYAASLKKLETEFKLACDLIVAISTIDNAITSPPQIVALVSQRTYSNTEWSVALCVLCQITITTMQLSDGWYSQVARFVTYCMYSSHIWVWQCNVQWFLIIITIITVTTCFSCTLCTTTNITKVH